MRLELLEEESSRSFLIQLYSLPILENLRAVMLRYPHAALFVLHPVQDSLRELRYALLREH